MNVFGLGCALDTLRFRFFLAEEAGVSVESVNGLVIGTHDDNMVPLVKYATIGGVGISDFLSNQQIDRVVEKTRKAGASIVRRLKTRGSFYAASLTVATIVAAMVHDTCGVFPVTVYCPEYEGYEDVCLNLPAVVGVQGIKKLVHVNLEEDERTAMAICARDMAAMTAATPQEFP